MKNPFLSQIAALILAPIMMIELSASSAFAQQCSEGSTCVDTVPADCIYDHIERTFRVFGCRASATAAWSGLDRETNRNSCLANPPFGTVIVDYECSDLSTNNGSHTCSRIGGGSTFSYTRVINESFDSLIKIAREEGNSRVADELEQEKESLLTFVETVSADQDTVRVEVTASAHGDFWDRKRGWASVETFLLVRCVAPFNLKDQLADRFGISQALAQGPREINILNDTDQTVYVHARIKRVEDSSCLDASGSSINSQISSGGEELIRVQLDDELCLTLGLGQVPEVNIPEQDFCVEKGYQYVTVSRARCLQEF